jgi:anti-sigma factor RsiW
MNCTEARQHWNLYHDSEGDPALHLQIGEHLAGCPACAEWFHQQSRLESLLAEKLRSQPGTPDPVLWNTILTRCGLKQPAASRRWLWLTGVAACAAVLLIAILWGIHAGRLDRGADLARLTVAWHQRLAEGEERVEFPSRSDRAVEAYLKKRVSFPVRCPPRQDAGFDVQGAGVGELCGQPTAYLSGHVGAAPVSIFIFPREALETFPRQSQIALAEKTHRFREGNYQMVSRCIDRNAVVVVGRASPERLERVLAAYGTYPDHP